MAALLRVRTKVNEALEPLRAAGRIGKSLDAAVILHVAPGDPLKRALEDHRDALAETFIVSEAVIGAPAEAGAPVSIDVRPCSEAGLTRCPRCWRWVPSLQAHPLGEVCPRCTEALESPAAHFVSNPKTPHG
jgi:isoleucyl-tRNA synthetase